MSMSNSFFQEVKEISRQRVLDILRVVAPIGKLIASEYVALCPCRSGDTRLGSFKFNVNSHQWSDFAAGVSGNDIISYAAYAFKLTQLEAAKRIQEMCGGTYIHTPSVDVKVEHMAHTPIAADEWQPITPIPEH